MARSTRFRLHPRMGWPSRFAALFTLASGLVQACGSISGVTEVSELGVIFITLSYRPNAVPEALFEGPVVVDEAGCLRLGGLEGITAIWPKGFGLDIDGTVRNADGRRVGTIGQSFRLGGGVTPMHDGLRFSSAEVRRILDRCPGKFWFPGEIGTADQ